MSADDVTLPAVTRTRVIVEHVDGEFMTLWPDGAVTVYLRAVDVVDAVKRRDAIRASRTHGAAVTTIEWRNVPDGFEPPR